VSERADEPVPKLPRGRGMKFSGPQLFRIGLTLVTLIGVLLLTKPCANAVSGFVTSFDGSGSAKEQSMPKPGNVDMPRDEEYEQLTPGMTPEEIKAAMERSKARNAAANAAAQGSATTGSAAQGNAANGSAVQGGATTGSASSSPPSASSSTPSGTTAPAPTKP
jgi:hypothetical protein